MDDAATSATVDERWSVLPALGRELARQASVASVAPLLERNLISRRSPCGDGVAAEHDLTQQEVDELAAWVLVAFGNSGHQPRPTDDGLAAVYD